MNGEIMSTYATRVDALATTSNVTRSRYSRKRALMYLGEREYTEDYVAHPEFHGMMMHWYLVGGEYEVPICDIQSIDRVDED